MFFTIFLIFVIAGWTLKAEQVQTYVRIRENLRIGAVEIYYLLRPRVLCLLLRIDRVSSYFRVTLPNKNYSLQDTAVSSFIQPRVLLSPSEENVLGLIAVNANITGEG